IQCRPEPSFPDRLGGPESPPGNGLLKPRSRAGIGPDGESIRPPLAGPSSALTVCGVRDPCMGAQTGCTARTPVKKQRGAARLLASSLILMFIACSWRSATVGAASAWPSFGSPLIRSVLSTLRDSFSGKHSFTVGGLGEWSDHGF